MNETNTAVDPQEEMNRRTEYFAKKKNIYHLHERTIRKLEEVLAVAKAEGVTPEQLMYSNIGSEKLLLLKEQLNHAKAMEQGVLQDQLYKAAKSGELANFDQAYKHDKEIEQKVEQDAKSYAEAKEKYKQNPTPFNAAKMIKTHGGMEDSNKEGYTQSDAEGRRETENLLRQKYQQGTAEREKEELETYEKIAKDEDDPAGQRIAQIKIKEIIRRKENREELAEKEKEYAENMQRKYGGGE